MTKLKTPRTCLRAGAEHLCFAQAAEKKPNIVIIWGDDIGQSNVSAYSHELWDTRRPTLTASPRKA